MSIEVKKLNSLKNPESFIQLTLIKGYKYVDKAGEIVNTYHKNNTPPVFSMNLNELRLSKPTDKIEELRVSAQMIWARFLVVDSLDMVATIFHKESKKILNILGTEKASRLGWRNYFIYEFESGNEQDKFFENITSFKGGQTNAISFEIKTDRKFKIILGLQPVVKTDGKTPGVLLDVDLSQDGEIDLKDFSKLLKEFREYLNDEKGFLGVVNSILSSS